MKYQLNEEQVNALIQALDITIKATGLQDAFSIVQLAAVFSKSANQTEESLKTVEINEDQLKVINHVLDTTLKQTGLNSMYGVLVLFELFKSPIEEQAPVEEPKIENN